MSNNIDNIKKIVENYRLEAAKRLVGQEKLIDDIEEADYYIGVNAFYDCDYPGCYIENNVAHNYGLRTYLVDVHVLSLPKKEIHYEIPTNK